MPAGSSPATHSGIASGQGKCASGPCLFEPRRVAHHRAACGGLRWCPRRRHFAIGQFDTLRRTSTGCDTTLTGGGGCANLSATVFYVARRAHVDGFSQHTLFVCPRRRAVAPGRPGRDPQACATGSPLHRQQGAV